MAETNNLKLALPTSNEYVDVEVLNENFKKIDTSVLLALAAAAPYSAAATYAQGAYCTKDGKLYRCTVAIPQAEAWNAAHWTETTMGAELVAIYTTLANKAAATHAAQHAKGGSDPITPESIGAAPGGHGLGATTIQEAPNHDANEITTTGWYMAGINVPNNAWWLVSSITYGNIMYQFAYANQDASGVLNGTVVQRSKRNARSDWTPWEYINPPMMLGVEYRTTERYLGKPVYAKSVNFGNAPSSSMKYVDCATNVDKVVDYSLVVWNGAFGQKNIIYDDSGKLLARPYVRQNGGSLSIALAVFEDISTRPVDCFVKYTKTTN